MRWICLFGAFFSLSYPIAIAQVSVEQSLATMKAGEGLQVELFAAEPMLINPTSIDVDERGRVWVAEAVNYRRKNFNRPILREEGDRIVILTDTNSDGKADESKVFYQGKELYGPLSVLVLPQVSGGHKPPETSKLTGYRVLVAQSPDILEFTDADGDLKADGPPKKFLTGFGGFDHDHGVHGLHVGPDGKLYFTVGDSGVTGLQSADGKGKKFVSNNTDVQKGTVWRCDLAGNNLELIAHNFRNNYEACVDSFGEIWCSDNDDDGNQQTRICFVMPGGNYGYGPRGPGQSHWHEEQPGIVHKVLRTGFGSPCGIQFYEGDTLPKQYHNTLMHCDAGPREVRAFTRKPKGAGYELDKTEMLTSSDNWFRPVDVCTAPDGSVFVADWYDPGVGGHGMGDHTRGRIYRLSPKDESGYKVRPLDLTTEKGVLAGLRSPCLSTRFAASSVQSIDAMKAIFRAMSDGDNAVRMRARWIKRDPLLSEKAIAFIPGGTTNTLAAALASDLVPDMIQGNLRIDRSTKQDGVSTVELERKVKNFIADKQGVAVFREVLLMLANAQDLTAAARLFRELAKLYDGQDHFYRAALNIACGTDPVRRDAILADFEKHFPEWNDKVADLVWELRPKSMLPKMQQLLVDDKITAKQKARIVDILAASDDLSAGKTMLGLLQGDATAEVKASAMNNLKLFLPTKWAALAKSQEFNELVKSLLSTPKTQEVGLQLVGLAKHYPSREKVSELAETDEPAPAIRLQAVKTLGQLPSMESAGALAHIMKDEKVQDAAIDGLASMITGNGESDVSKMGKLVLGTALVDTKNPMSLRLGALRGLASSRAGTALLLKMKESNELPEALHREAGKLLRNSPFQGERNKAMILFPAPGKLNPKALPAAAVLATRTGNAANGAKIMAASLKGETQCLKCHMVRGQGGAIGPDLSLIGKKGSKENLHDSILQPSKAIADQYVTWNVTTLAGQTISGLLVGETETTLTIRDANGKDYPIAIKDIDEKKKSLVSIMPEGLAATLTEDELVDVVEYLMTLQTASITPDSWLVAGPFKANTMTEALKTAFPPEKGGFDLTQKFGAMSWTLLKSSTPYFDLAALHGNAAQNSATYALTEIVSPVDQEATILLGSDDGAVVFVNGVEVFRTEATRAAAAEQDTIKVKLKAGKNLIMLKVANGNNPHGFYLTVLSAQELKAK